MIVFNPKTGYLSAGYELQNHKPQTLNHKPEKFFHMVPAILSGHEK
jgi:hypothetical protein